MRGHEPIIAMRQRGKRPAIVFVNDFPCQTGWEDFGDHATVCVHLDSIAALDLRWSIGMTVSFLADTEERAKQLAEAFRAAGAKGIAVGAVDQRGARWESTFAEINHG